MGFLNPAMLGLLGLGAVPVVIHLLNRRRYQVVAWPAMEFLLRAQVKTRKRLRMENLLLLLARTLAVLCFCLAATRPFLPSAAGIAGLQPERTHLYVVLDNSASMAYAEGMNPLLRQAARRIDEAMAEIEADDPVTLVVTCDSGRRMSGEPVVLLRGTRDHAKVRDELEHVLSWPAGYGESGASDSRMDPAAALAAVMDVAEPGDPRRLLRVYSDFRRSDWAPLDSGISQDAGDPPAGEGSGGAASGSAGTSGANAVRTQLERLKEARFDIDGAFVPVGSRDAVDIAVVSVLPADGRMPSEGRATSFEVVVANQGAATADVHVSFAVDGREIATRRIEVRGRGAGAGSATTGRTAFTWSGIAGPHVATATVECDGDKLQRDNVRQHAFRVRDRVRILAVDGDPSPGPGRFPETRLLETALSISQGVLPTDVQVVPSSDLAATEFDAFDVILLANVDVITEATWERLRGRVRAGAGLWIFLGDRTDPGLWNGVTRRPETRDLLPARLDARPRIDIERPVTLDVGTSTHPALRELTDPRHGTSFEPPLVAGWWPVQQPLEDGVEVLLHFRDLDRTPALLERRCGRGRVMLYTSSADMDWTGPSLFFAPWIQETVAYLASAGERPRDVLVNETLVVDVPPTAQGFAMKVGSGIGGDGQNHSAISVSATEEAPEASQAVFFRDTSVQGTYTLSWKQAPETGGIAASLESREAYFAVNLDPRECDLARLDEDDLRARFGSAAGFAGEEEASEGSAEASLGGAGDLTRSLLMAGLLLLVTEMFLATWFGRKRG